MKNALFFFAFLILSPLTHAEPFTNKTAHPNVRYIYNQVSEALFLADSGGQLVVYNYKYKYISKGLGTAILSEDVVTATSDGATAIVGKRGQIEIINILTAARKVIDYETIDPKPNGKYGYYEAFVTRDNKLAVLFGHYYDIVVISLETREIVWQKRRMDQGGFRRMEESPDGRHLFFGNGHKAPLLYDRDTNAAAELPKGYGSAEHIYDGTFDANSQNLIFYNAPHNLIRYELATQTYHELEPELTRINRIFASPDNKYLFLVRFESHQPEDPDNHRMYLFDAENLRRIRISVPVGEFKPYLIQEIIPGRDRFIFRHKSAVYELNHNTRRWNKFSLPENFALRLIGTRDCQSILGNDMQLDPFVTEAY